MNYEEIYKTNMNYVSKNFDLLYNKINNACVDDFILIEKNGNYNIEYKNEKIYPEVSSLAISLQVTKFIAQPSSMFERPFIHKEVEGKDYIHDKYLLKLDQISPFLSQNNTYFDYYKNSKKTIPYLIIFGVGTGQHIIELIRQVDIRRLVIVDENFNLLKLSMHITNWTEILEYFTQDDRKIEFTFGNDAKVVGYTLINNIYANNPFIFFYFNIFMHYRTPFFNEIEKALQDKVNQGFTGWGFFDDEMIGLKQTIDNIKSNISIYYSNQSILKYKKDFNAFIIGSGPSLDNDIQEIKKHQNNAIIFSCGSALKVLYTHDIIPDFHIEMERNGRYDLLRESTDDEFIKKISLLAVNVVRTDSFAPFKNGKIFVRDSDASSRLIPSSFPHLDFCNPTAPNAALSLLQHLNVKNIFLFGLDMGFKSEKNHHSKDSLYYKKGHRLANFQELTTGIIPSNFTNPEPIYTTRRLEWAKQRLENCLTYNSNLNLKVYNCSDGAQINGTNSVHSYELEQYLTQIDKKSVLDIFEKCFLKADDQNTFDQIEKQLTMQKNMFELSCNELNILLQVKIHNFYEFYKLMYLIYGTLTTNNRNYKDSLLFPLVKGTFSSMLARIYTHSLACGETEESIDFINESLKIMKDFLEESKKEFLNLKL